MHGRSKSQGEFEIFFLAKIRNHEGEMLSEGRQRACPQRALHWRMIYAHGSPDCRRGQQISPLDLC